jgi:hypothetical protein
LVVTTTMELSYALQAICFCPGHSSYVNRRHGCQGQDRETEPVPQDQFHETSSSWYSIQVTSSALKWTLLTCAHLFNDLVVACTVILCTNGNARGRLVGFLRHFRPRVISAHGGAIGWLSGRHNGRPRHPDGVVLLTPDFHVAARRHRPPWGCAIVLSKQAHLQTCFVLALGFRPLCVCEVSLAAASRANKLVSTRDSALRLILQSTGPGGHRNCLRGEYTAI